jgi:hypothetical protein
LFESQSWSMFQMVMQMNLPQKKEEASCQVVQEYQQD